MARNLQVKPCLHHPQYDFEEKVIIILTKKNMEQELTFGEKAVGLTFNPSGDEKVTKIKKLYAEIIDILADENPNNADVSLKGRILGRAINDAIGSQMWAVKAITYKD